MNETFYAGWFACLAQNRISVIIERRRVTSKILSGAALFLFVCGVITGCSSSRESVTASAARYGITVEQYNYVESETAPGGKLDFTRDLAANKLNVIGDVAYNRTDTGFFLWGQAMRRLGIRNSEDAVSLYEEVTAQTLKETHRQAIRNGFNYKEGQSSAQ